MPEAVASYLTLLAPYVGPGSAFAAAAAIGARKTLSRLVAGVTDVMLIPVEDIKRDAEDRRQERSQDRRDARARRTQLAVAAERGDDLLERALISEYNEAKKRQTNKEKVAQAFVEDIAPKLEAGETAEVEPEEDWMNVFGRYAEDASSERMQKLWGRVLSGEVRNSGSFSLTTLRVIAELDQRTASFFEAFTDEIVSNFVPAPDIGIEGKRFEMINHLETLGFISGLDGTRSKVITLKGEDAAFMACHEFAVDFYGTLGYLVRPPAYLLTATGIELLKVVPPKNVERNIRIWIENLRKDGLNRIVLHKILKSVNEHQVILDDGEVLWESAPQVN